MTALILSSVRVRDDGAHDVVTIFNRGALAGEIRVQRGDGARIRELVEAIAAWNPLTTQDRATRKLSFIESRDRVDEAVRLMSDPPSEP